MRKDDRGDDRGRIREALRRAAQGAEPDMSRLLEAVPGIVTEARRRRAREARRDGIAAIVPLAGRLIPRLAAATAVLVLISAGLYLEDGTTRSSDDPLDMRALVLTGTADDESPDLLLEAVVDRG